MTDKRIIVDVTKCKYRDTYTNFCKAEKDDIGECYIICTGNDCYYKQLKRAQNQIVDLNKMVDAKEQECERLKRDYFKQNEWLKEQKKELDQLKVEKEELKDEIKHYKQIAQYHGNLSVKYTNKSAKYKQTLAKIKEIAETISLPMGTGNSSNRVILAKQILQKISECEVK